MSLVSKRPRAAWSRLGLVALVGVASVLWMTGLVLNGLGGEWSPDAPAWQGPAHRVAQVMHGVLAWAACVLVGRWVWPHVSLMWTRRGGRGQAWWLGLVTLLVGLLMAGTGLGLLYGPADWREDSLALHWWMGLGWPLLCLVHGLRQRI